jgi:signal recognition particle subunit SRP54
VTRVFESLTERLQGAFRALRSKGVLTEQDIKAGMREVRLALLEADVNFRVVKQFIADVSERAAGAEVTKSVTPGQQVVKIVHDELVKLLGGAGVHFDLSPTLPTVIALCGLQGSGKTTTCAKLGLRLHKQGERVLLAATDVKRPAAIEQLRTIGAGVGLDVFDLGERVDAVNVARAAVAHAKAGGYSVAILDTAGRLHVDEEMMAELRQIVQETRPWHTLLVLDALTGQDAVQVAEAFSAQADLTGLVLTKLDGDARGGAALSLRAVTGKPILFAGVGEKPTDFELFHPDRMASRILGMGDVVTLVERAQEHIAAEEAARLQQRLLSDKFDLEDFRERLRDMRKMGPLDQLLGMIPGVKLGPSAGAMDIDERELDRVEAIINSMTLEERRSPDILNASRKRRVAAGSGTTVQDINALLKQFKTLKKWFRSVADGKRRPMGLGWPRL